MKRINYTKLKLGSYQDDDKIVLCTKCGKKGKLRVYSRGGQSIVHYATDTGIGRVIKSGDYCHFNQSELQK